MMRFFTYMPVKFMFRNMACAMSPVGHQAITWTNAGLLLIRLLRENEHSSEYIHEIYTYVMG